MMFCSKRSDRGRVWDAARPVRLARRLHQQREVDQHTHETDDKQFAAFMRHHQKTKPVRVRVSRKPKIEVEARIKQCEETACCTHNCLNTMALNHKACLAHQIERWGNMCTKQRTSEAFHYMLSMRVKHRQMIASMLETGVRVAKSGVKRNISAAERDRIQNKRMEYTLFDPTTQSDIPVCCDALQFITGTFGGTLRSSINKMLDDGHEQHYAEVLFSRQTRHCTKSSTVMSWVQHQIQVMGDHMPDQENRMWLPYENLDEAHKHYCNSVQEGHFADWDVYTPASKSLFGQIVRTHFSKNIRFTKKYNTFTKCNTCSDYKLRIKERGANSAAGKVWWKHYWRHLMWQAECRKKYADHRTKAKAFPSKYMSIIIDGSDNHSFEIPFFGCKRKDWAGLSRPSTRSTGVLVHTGSDDIGIGGLHLYITDERTKKGTNFNITVLMHTLIQEAKARGGTLPPIVYFQMDSAGDNKSKTMARFAEWLVKAGVFLKVKICMLPVGHTHEDIDSSFGRLNRRFVESGTKTTTTAAGLARAQHATKVTRGLTWIKVWEQLSNCLYSISSFCFFDVCIDTNVYMFMCIAGRDQHGCVLGPPFVRQHCIRHPNGKQHDVSEKRCCVLEFDPSE
jgi:hypothetical protein